MFSLLFGFSMQQHPAASVSVILPSGGHGHMTLLFNKRSCGIHTKHCLIRSVRRPSSVRLDDQSRCSRIGVQAANVDFGACRCVQSDTCYFNILHDG